jgi:hypothetical protein
MVNEIQQIRDKINIKLHDKEQLEISIANLEREEIYFKRRLKAAEKARTILQIAAKRTMKRVEQRISNLVSLALATVFDDPEQFVVKLEERRDQIECDLLFKKGDQYYDPIDFTGGGILDITCLALRVAFLLLNKNIRRILFLDEPAVKLHGKTFQERTSRLFKMLSEEKDIQIIIANDISEINLLADKVFIFYLEKGITKVKVSP